MKVASTVITTTTFTTTTTTTVNTNAQPQFQSVKPRPFITYQNTSLKKTNVVVSKGKENKQKSRNISLVTDKNQYIYSYDRLVTKPKLDF